MQRGVSGKIYHLAAATLQPPRADLRFDSLPVPVREALQRFDRHLLAAQVGGWLRAAAMTLCVCLAVTFLLDLSFAWDERDLRFASGLLGLLFSVWVILFLWRRVFRRPTWLALASLLEQKHAPLAERLVSLVSADGDAPATALLPLLANQTSQEVSRIDWDALNADSASRRRWLPTAAVAFVFLLGFALLPGFHDFHRRLLGAWFSPDTAYAFQVTPGSTTILQGSSVVIRVQLEQRSGETRMPTACVLQKEGQSTAMELVEPGVFQASLADVSGAFDYQIVTGRHASETFHLRTVEPLAWAHTPTILATPPPYLPAVAKAVGDSALRYSDVSFAFPLSRHVSRAKLVLTSGEKSRQEIPLALAQPATALTCRWLAAQPGEWRSTLHAEDEHGLAFALPLPAFRVHDDRPPRFRELLRVSGIDSASREVTIRPDDVLRVATTVEDDEGLSRIDLEYRVNEGPTQSVRWIDAWGQTELKIDGQPPLPRSLARGDRLRFRLRAFDNRQLTRSQFLAENGARFPDHDLNPQSVVEPNSASGDAWIECFVDVATKPLRDREILAQAASVQQKIGEIQRKLAQEQQRVAKLRRDTHQQPALTAEQQRAVGEVQKQNREIVQDLVEQGQELAGNPELAPLAELFWQIAHDEMQRSGAALEQFADKARTMEDREKQTQSAELALEQARAKLDKLKDTNQRLAQDRLDQHQIAKLAQRQDEVAKQLESAKLSEQELAELRNEQSRIAEQLQKLREQSQLLQEALAKQRPIAASDLAKVAQTVVDQQRKQAKEREKMRQAQAGPLEALTKRQAELARVAQAYANEQKGPMLLEAQRATQSLQQGNGPGAVQEQRDTEKTLADWSNRLAGSPVVGDLREAVEKLARTQKEIRSDLEKLGEQIAQLQELALKQRLQELVQRQRTLASDVAKLPIDRANATLHGLHQSAGADASEAGNRLGARDTLQAHAKMEQAQQQLENLARLVPAETKPDPALVKDPSNRKKIERIEGFAKEQKSIREAAERLLAEAKKSGGGAGDPGEEKERLDELASGLMKLSQQAGSEKEKAFAKETAAALQEAMKAKQAAEGLDQQGKKEQARALEAKAMEKLEIVAKKGKDMPQAKQGEDDAMETARSLDEAKRDVEAAQKSMATKPGQANKSAQQAGKSLGKLAQAAKQQMQRRSRPPLSPDQPSATASAGAGAPSAIPLQPLLAAHGAKSWGDLPGEVKTRVLQDLRSRYGDDYAVTIQRYFERLSAMPASNESPR